VDVYESVLAQLNALISESGMQRGDRLPPERKLVERLGVSRVSIRSHRCEARGAFPNLAG
jgi:GntR family transcriptional repressor for pyruvate dehydrogenase complex